MGRILLVLCLLLAGCSTPSPKVHCSGLSAAPERILIYGDSWARPEIAEELSASTGARVCAESYPGANSTQLRGRMDVLRSKAALGGTPSTVVIISGVNDALGHFGAASYVEAVRAMHRTWRDAGARRVFSLELPDFRPGYSLGGPEVQAPKAVRQRLYDGGRDYVVPQYRAALAAAGVPTIDYQAFIPSYRGHETAYGDPLHLTDQEYRRLGRYLAAALEP